MGKKKMGKKEIHLTHKI